MPDRIIAAEGMPSERIGYLLALGDGAVVVDTRPDRGNARLGLSDLERLLPRPPSAVERDLLSLSAALVVGDTAHRRGPNEQCSRDLVCHFAAREPKALRPVLPELQSLLGFITGDSVRIELETRRSRELEATGWTARPLDPPADGGCLLAGGLDSVAGAVVLLTAGRLPVFVVRATGNAMTRASQAASVNALSTRFGPTTVVTVPLHGMARKAAEYAFPEGRDREPSQRVRSLFPLAVAAVLCAGLGLAEIHVPENGILAAQVPFTRARVGSFTTRTTNPRWLDGVAEVFSTLLGAPVAVRNPLLGQTKAEIVRDVLLRSLGEDAVRATTSCWSIGRGPLACGGCVPCILRRFAFEVAGLAPEAVQRDALGVRTADESEGRRNLVAVLSLARDFLMLPDDCLRVRYPEIAYAGEASGTTIAALRRFAAEVRGLAETRFPDMAALLGIGHAKNEHPSATLR